MSEMVKGEEGGNTKVRGIKRREKKRRRTREGEKGGE